MTSEEVLKVLKKGDWMTSKEIQIKDSLSNTSVNNSLRSLYKTGLIFKKDQKRIHGYRNIIPIYKAK